MKEQKRKNSNIVPIVKPCSNTTKKLGGVTGKGFMPGADPKRNLKGRPRGFDVLRDLARSIAEESSGIKDKSGAEFTNAQMILRTLMKNDGAKFLEIAYGKIPQPVEHTGFNGESVKMKIVVVNTDDPDSVE